MKRLFIYGTLFLLGLKATAVFAQDSTSVIGTWKGTSICQQKNSPCHDEISVCHVVKTSTPLQYQFTMNKVIDNKEENMGTIIFIYDSARKAYISAGTGRDAVWQFNITGSKMNGTLTYQNKLFRIIQLQKQ